MEESRDQLARQAQSTEDVYQQALKKIEAARQAGELNNAQVAELQARLDGERIARKPAELGSTLTEIEGYMGSVPLDRTKSPEQIQRVIDAFLDGVVVASRLGIDFHGGVGRDKYGVLDPSTLSSIDAKRISTMKQSLVTLLQSRGTTVLVD